MNICFLVIVVAGQDMPPTKKYLEPEEDGEAVTYGLLNELRLLADEIGHGHLDYGHRFPDLLQKTKNPNLPDVALEMGFRVVSFESGTRNMKRTIAVCANISIARAAYECA